MVAERGEEGRHDDDTLQGRVEHERKQVNYYPPQVLATLPEILTLHYTWHGATVQVILDSDYRVVLNTRCRGL